MLVLAICKTSTGICPIEWGAACMQDYKEQSASFGVWLSELNTKLLYGYQI